MKLWFRLTIICGALVCLLLGLSQPSASTTRGRLSARDHGSIEVKKPRSTCHSLGGHKHGIRSGLRWASGIFGPRLRTDCRPSWSTRPGNPPATRTDRALTSYRSSRQSTNGIEHLSPRNQRLSTVELKNRAFATAFS